MTFGPFLIAGAVVVFTGMMLFALAFARPGGMQGSQQFRIFGELWRGEHGPRARRVLLLSLVLMPVGACLCFTGVARSDQARAERCRVHCEASGYEHSRIGPSTAEPTFVACICEGEGLQTVEHRANDL